MLTQLLRLKYLELPPRGALDTLEKWERKRASFQWEAPWNFLSFVSTSEQL